MTIVFEPSQGFERVDYFYRQLAIRHLLGRKFGSLEEALRITTTTNKKDFPLSHYLKVNGRRVTPMELPYTISDVDIIGVSRDEDGTLLHNTPGISVPIVVARYIE